MRNKIRQFRSLRNISQQELANDCGVSRETICRVETNKANPSLALAYHIARSLNASVEDLFFLDEPETGEALLQ